MRYLTLLTTFLWMLPVCSNASGEEDTSGELVIISHFRSGTTAALAVFQAICKNRKWDQHRSLRTAEDASIKAQGNGLFGWNQQKQSKQKQQLESMLNSEETHTAVHDECNGAKYHSNGLESGVNFLAPPKKPQSGIHYMHFIRHPVDMLVSSYLHLKSCSEPWTQDLLSEDESYFLPPGFNLQEPYCKYLQHSSLEDGLKTELMRSLDSTDGIGNMLKHALFLQNQNQLRICVFQAEKYIPSIQRFMRPWNEANHPINLAVYKDSLAEDGLQTHEAEAQIYIAALGIVRDEIPDEVLRTFPCGTAFFGDDNFEVSSQFFSSLISSP